MHKDAQRVAHSRALVVMGHVNLGTAFVCTFVWHHPLLSSMSRRSSLSDAQDGDISTTPTLGPSDHESDEKVRNLKRRFEHVEVRLHITVAAAPMY
jgi:hypothetical protein